MDCSPPGSSVHGILQARILDRVVLPGDLLNPGIEPASPALAGGFSTTEQARKHHNFFQFSSVQLLSNSFQFSSVQSLKSCPTLCNPMNRSTSGLPVQCMKVKSESEVVQSCPTLSDPMDCSLPGSCVHGIFQARVLEWGAIAFSGFPLYSPSNFYILFSPLLTPLPFVFIYGRNAPASGPLHLLFHLPSTCCPLITTQLTLLPPAISL